MTAAHYKGGHHPGNDLGLHSTALPPIGASCPYSDQLLVTRKFWSPGANRPSQVKVGMFGSNLPRPVPSAAAEDPESRRFTVWYDVLGIDSPYDYDPVWQKCVELGVAPTFHSASSGQGLRLSPSNFVYNHLGHFPASG